MVQANDVARPKSRHSERMPLVLGGTQLHGETLISGLHCDGTPVYVFYLLKKLCSCKYTTPGG